MNRSGEEIAGFSSAKTSEIAVQAECLKGFKGKVD
jgi:hypothetical protein